MHFHVRRLLVGNYRKFLFISFIFYHYSCKIKQIQHRECMSMKAKEKLINIIAVTVNDFKEK